MSAERKVEAAETRPYFRFLRDFTGVRQFPQELHLGARAERID